MSVISQNISSFFSHLFWSNLNWDMVLIISLFIGSVLYTVFLGKQRVLLILTAVYVTLGILAYAPFIGRLGEIIGSLNKTIYFAITFIVLFFILIRGVLDQVFVSGGYVANWWQVLLLAFFQLGLITSIIFSFLPKNYLENFSLFIQSIFLDSWGRFAWLLLPIVLMAAVGRKSEDE